MAEASKENHIIQTKSVLCRYFLSGVCREGASCKFSHDRGSATPDNICRFYLKGSCTYGNTCRYDHIRAERLTNTSQSSTSNGGRGQAPKSNEKPSCRSLQTLAGGGNKKCSRSDPPTGQMTVLRPRQNTRETTLQDLKGSSNNNKKKNSTDWLSAPEFVPKVQKSYADTMRGEKSQCQDGEEQGFPVSSFQQPVEQEEGGMVGVSSSLVKSLLCPYALMGDCGYGDQCQYLHGDVCDFCGNPCLHPFDQEQRHQHIQDCIHEHEREMELSFAVQRSQNKVCGICMDVVMEKEPVSERRFGILEKCSHVFCLNCIRKWRGTKTFENKTIRGCPECRTSSDFVTPSKFWVDTSEEKDKLISDYKTALSLKPCKYFEEGRGECPFAGACFYLHAYPDGSKAQMSLPHRRRRRNQNGDLEAVQRIIMWDFFEVRENNLLLHLELEDMFDILSDIDDDTDLSDFDLILE